MYNPVALQEVALITSIRFQNFKALKDTTLPLGPFTLIVGPNGSGKSTAMQSLRFFLKPGNYPFDQVVTAGLKDDPDSEVSIQVKWTWRTEQVLSLSSQRRDRAMGPENLGSPNVPIGFLKDALVGFKVFSLDADAIAASVQTEPFPDLQPNGSNLAAVLDALTDSEPEIFEALNEELHRWLPEFDRILFETPGPGRKAFLLRTTNGKFRYRASDLSHGTLYALALLTMAWLPNRPKIVCFEEPDRGIHPRLLSEIRDAMYRLAYPQNFGDVREPVQVIATTHSPYLLDLFKEHPEEVVISHKDDEGVHFVRLSEKPHIHELLDGAPLGDIWFSGILGGVPPSP
jgi:predicted ATPase